VDDNLFWEALALVLVIEGLLPFAAPALWRKIFSQVQQLSLGQIRGFGLLSIVIGVGALLLLK